jgi:hypothetical protein
MDALILGGLSMCRPTASVGGQSVAPTSDSLSDDCRELRLHFIGRSDIVASIRANVWPAVKVGHLSIAENDARVERVNAMRWALAEKTW